MFDCLKFYDCTCIAIIFVNIPYFVPCPLAPFPIPEDCIFPQKSRSRKVKEVNSWIGSVLQPLVSYFYVSSRRVTPCSLLATGISAQVSELHHLHGIRKTLEYDSKGREGCLTSVWRAAKWKKPQCCILLSYTYNMDHSGSALCWMGPFLSF